MQIHVKAMAWTWSFDVEPATTLAELRSLVADRLRREQDVPVGPDSIRILTRGGVPVTAVDIGTLGLNSGDGLQAVVGPGTSMGTSASAAPARPQYDVAVQKVLARDLIYLSGQERTFVFVGIGSHSGSVDPTSIKRQQCPDAVVEACAAAGLQLQLVLIDSLFGGRLPGAQLYDIDAGWQPEPPAWGDPFPKVQRYRHSGTGTQLVTYMTTIPVAEYAIASRPLDEASANGPGRMLAGIDLAEVGYHLAVRQGGLVAGNFYPADIAPYCVAGAPDLLTAIGPPYYFPELWPA
jgi:hypothetical protein